jgi:hypothetical protein
MSANGSEIHNQQTGEHGELMMKAESKNDLPEKLSQPALRALIGAGYTRLEQIAQVSEQDLLKLHGMGPKGIETLRQALKDKGLRFTKP